MAGSNHSSMRMRYCECALGPALISIPSPLTGALRTASENRAMSALRQNATSLPSQLRKMYGAGLLILKPEKFV
jgi:hypothetical protein